MTIYVDSPLLLPGHIPAQARLYSADEQELREFARQIGARQNLCRRSPVFHWTLGRDARARAVAAGAREVSQAELTPLMGQAVRR